MSSFLKLMMKKKELIPLVSFLSLATGGALTMCVYSLMTKSDVTINKTGNPTPWENIDTHQPQKVGAHR
uniref:Normal mucosa of esophagus-specific gene 1 protein-like n=1 Tax=Callorhinchus milii TaxID=7868 RepID=A0A4W3H4S9_CALMI